VDDGRAFQKACIAREEFRREVVRSLEYDVRATNQCATVLRQEARANELDIERPSFQKWLLSRVQFVATDVFVTIEDLAVKIRRIHDVVVTQE
jgi:hypothetical protein